MAQVAQPNASSLPDQLLAELIDEIPDAGPAEAVARRDQHSNDFAEVRLRDGRSLIVKRARFDWAAPRFHASRIASELIAQATDIRVPRPLPVRERARNRPIEAYWRIAQPVLGEVWASLDEQQRSSALRSLGRLVARLHRIERVGFGPLAQEAVGGTLGEHLRGELRDRLLPGVWAEWPAAVPSLELLIRHIDEVEQRAGGRARLVHNDLHLGNVLCEVGPDRVRATGLIDLETAIAAPAEADLAGLELHHGDLFDHPLPTGWLEEVYQGYGTELDRWVVRFYRALHMVNMGFYSALIGHAEHAGRVAERLAEEVAAL